jgi:hypothetical protein
MSRGRELGPDRARRALAVEVLLVAIAVLLAFGPDASAAPTVTFKVTPRPIPGFPGTGNILGAGAEVESHVKISGSEYGGFPSPLTGIHFFTPRGVKVDSAGFATCASSVLEAFGTSACPERSKAGPVGEGLGVVSFGGSRVYEKVSINSVFSTVGGLIFYAEGTTPAYFQVLEKAHWSSAAPPYSQELLVEVPLVETVPEAPDASILSFNVTIGAAYRKGSRMVSYITLPKHCPRGGAPLKAELKFLSGETSTVAFKQPCPKH